MREIEIFKAGTHTSSSGQSLTFTPDDLRRTAEYYNKYVHEAPLVVGHPKENGPAYGWVKELKFDGNRLTAIPSDVDSEFSDLVKSRRYSKVSASFYTPDSPQNPVPGVYSLRHVGFLGAMAPAIKGLKPVQFDSGDEGLVEFSIDVEENNRAITEPEDLLALREVIEETYTDGITAIPQASIDSSGNIVGVFIDKVSNNLTKKFNFKITDNNISYQMTKDTLKYMEDLEQQELEFAEKLASLRFAEASAKEREAALEKRESELAAKEKNIKQQAITSFCDSLVKEGKVLAAQSSNLIEFMMGLGEDNSLNFGEGKEESPVEFFKGFLTTLPKQVEFNEVAKDVDNLPLVADFTAPAGFAINPDSAELHNKVVAYQKKHPEIDYVTALSLIG